MKLASLSNPSLESQLVHDFAAHANVAGSPSLGHHNTSTTSFGAAIGQAQGSAPTSPYGHPKGNAVAQGVGMGRNGHGHGLELPSIRNWEAGAGEGINPMFRVVSSNSLLSRDREADQSLQPSSRPILMLRLVQLYLHSLILQESLIILIKGLEVSKSLGSSACTIMPLPSCIHVVFWAGVRRVSLGL